MSKYKIELNYISKFIADIEADDEGSALEKARNMAEDADMSEFTLADEREARVLSVN